MLSFCLGFITITKVVFHIISSFLNFFPLNNVFFLFKKVKQGFLSKLKSSLESVDQDQCKNVIFEDFTPSGRRPDSRRAILCGSRYEHWVNLIF